jgi:hypothetical protein
MVFPSEAVELKASIKKKNFKTFEKDMILPRETA